MTGAFLLTIFIFHAKIKEFPKSFNYLTWPCVCLHPAGLTCSCGGGDMLTQTAPWATRKCTQWPTFVTNELNQWRELHSRWPTPLISINTRDGQKERGQMFVLIIYWQTEYKAVIETNSSSSWDRLCQDVKSAITKCSSYAEMSHLICTPAHRCFKTENISSRCMLGPTLCFTCYVVQSSESLLIFKVEKLVKIIHLVAKQLYDSQKVDKLGVNPNP